jgi:PAS domain S-box-containing protein
VTISALVVTIDAPDVTLGALAVTLGALVVTIRVLVVTIRVLVVTMSSPIRDSGRKNEAFGHAALVLAGGRRRVASGGAVPARPGRLFASSASPLGERAHGLPRSSPSRRPPRCTMGARSTMGDCDSARVEDEHAKLVEAEWRLNAAQAVAHVGSWERDLDADRAVWSEEVYRILGLRPEEFDGTMAGFLARCQPDDAERIRQAYALVVSRPGPVALDFRIVRADGDVRVIHAQLEMIGPGRRVIGAGQDVTEQRASEQRLKTACSLLEATLESTADGLLVVALPDQRIVKYNAKFAALWCIPPEILRAHADPPLLAFVEDQLVDPEAFAARVAEMYAHPEQESHDEIRLKDGRVLERYSQAQRVDGTPVGRVWSFRDVTDRRRAEAERDQFLEGERAAREEAQAAAARAGLQAEASRLLTSLDHESALASLAHLLVGAFADCCAVDMIEPDGSMRRVAVAPYGAAGATLPCRPPDAASSLAVLDDHALLGVPLAIAGRPLGAMRLSRAHPRTFGAADLALAEDLAARASLAIEIARLYRRSEDALRARDEFLSVASHELRTPIATLQATVDTLLAGAHGAIPPEGPLARPLRSLGRQAVRLSRLANRIHDAVALTEDGLALHVTQEDLSAIAAAVVARVGADGVRPPGEVTLSAPDPVIGRWDRGRIGQLICSLTANALRFGAGKPVALTVGRRGERALLTVQDHGVGIATDRLPTLFDRFDRAGAARSWGGLGLGLYIVRAIVDLHGGSIRVESRLGEGTTFFVELPLAGPPVPS